MHTVLWIASIWSDELCKQTHPRFERSHPRVSDVDEDTLLAPIHSPDLIVEVDIPPKTSVWEWAPGDEIEGDPTEGLSLTEELTVENDPASFYKGALIAPSGEVFGD